MTFVPTRFCESYDRAPVRSIRASHVKLPSRRFWRTVAPPWPKLLDKFAPTQWTSGNLIVNRWTTWGEKPRPALSPVST